MSYNGSGVFDPPAAPEYPAVAGDVIYAAYFNTVMQEIFDGLSNCITKDGQSVVGADINWGNKKLLNVSRLVIGTLTDNGNPLQVTGNSTFTGNLTSAGRIAAAGLSGFASATFAPDARNPIWRFLNADGYGLSFFQGTSGDGGLDSIGIHFGTPTAAGSPFSFKADGTFRATSYEGITKSSVGLGNVDNTSDATKNAASVTLTNKTISGSANTLTNIAQSSVTSLVTDLGLKAPLASPALTGTPTVPTAAPGTNTTQAASTAFVTAAVAAIGAPPVSYRVYKTASTSRASTTTATADPHLLLTNPASGIYSVKGLLRWNPNGSTTNGLKVFFATTGGGSLNQVLWTGQTNSSSANAAPTANGASVFSIQANTGGSEIVLIDAIYSCTSTSTLGISWAQVASEATATELYNYSWLEITKLD